MNNYVDGRSGVGGRESGVGGGREYTTSVFEGGFYGGGFGEVVVLLFGDEDLGAATGFELLGYEGAQEAGAAGQHYAFFRQIHIYIYIIAIEGLELND